MLLLKRYCYCYSSWRCSVMALQRCGAVAHVTGVSCNVRHYSDVVLQQAVLHCFATMVGSAA